ncbi:hypothetical protein [Nonomuraea roseoviolacea]|uniref:Uncharacterized protein n=1 Tax=Nonomuraea roseoviolacea subsp. carminata TaxID=160689 RepID=A0ABT1K2B3_9ACTN|nr:hypothetical protein [Nonomuraea roseoviolacea]MCP2347752.1 hypothetical protein [Nonomuraea roseoviolacea subsp. carminata]
MTEIMTFIVDPFDLPPNEIPANIPVGQMFVEARRCAVFVERIAIFSRGLEVQVGYHVREDALPPDDGFSIPLPGSLDDMSLELRAEGQPKRLAVQNTGASSQGFSGRMFYWAAPVPRGQGLDLSISWPSLGVESRHWLIRRADLEEAVSGVRVLWR